MKTLSFVITTINAYRCASCVWRIMRARRIAILGRNGAGKSTLYRRWRAARK
ncbi:hypothetical protein KCP70_04725 [Salmonella enterica subsp. enterica]|nr:hypothetical protein KCP70_04725 [Salmonella enterica subsp. enterica]